MSRWTIAFIIYLVAVGAIVPLFLLLVPWLAGVPL